MGPGSAAPDRGGRVVDPRRLRCGRNRSPRGSRCAGRRPPPLSDLTDANGRALRWSIVTASTVSLPVIAAAEVDEAEVGPGSTSNLRCEELSDAMDRVGGDTARRSTESAQRFAEAWNVLGKTDGYACWHRPHVRRRARRPAAPWYGCRNYAEWRSGQAQAERQALSTAAVRWLGTDCAH